MCLNKRKFIKALSLLPVAATARAKPAASEAAEIFGGQESKLKT